MDYLIGKIFQIKTFIMGLFQSKEKDCKSYSFSSKFDEELYNFYLEQRSFFWTENEVDFTKDIEDWNSLTDGQRKFLKFILTFFLHSDGLVCENIQTRFSKDIRSIPGAEKFYNIQLVIENIHEIVYDKFVNVYIENKDEIEKLNKRIDIDPSINKKISWIEKWMGSNKSFSERLVAFAIIEGIFFTGSFASIFYLKHIGKMNGLAQANELIARDEKLHCDFACFLYKNRLHDKIKYSKIIEIIREAVQIEEEFYKKSLDLEVIGLDKEDMIQYIKYTADKLLENLDENKYYLADNPFNFMENIDLGRKTNFFERKPTEYLMVEKKKIRFDNV